MEEKPITDRDNFPGGKAEPIILPSIAYADGVADGYRKAMLDIMLWTLALILCLKLLPSLSH